MNYEIGKDGIGNRGYYIFVGHGQYLYRDGKVRVGAGNKASIAFWPTRKQAEEFAENHAAEQKVKEFWNNLGSVQEELRECKKKRDEYLAKIFQLGRDKVELKEQLAAKDDRIRQLSNDKRYKAIESAHKFRFATGLTVRGFNIVLESQDGKLITFSEYQLRLQCAERAEQFLTDRLLENDPFTSAEQDELRECKKQIESMKRVLEDQDKMIGEKDDRIRQLEEDLNKVLYSESHEIGKLRRSVKEKDERIKELEAELQQIKTLRYDPSLNIPSLSKYEEMIKNWEKRCDNLKTCLIATQDRRDGLLKDLEQAQTEIKNQEHNLKVYMNRAANQEKRADDLEHANKVLHVRLQDLRGECDAIDKHRENCEARRDYEKGKKEEFHSRLIDAEGEITKLQDALFCYDQKQKEHAAQLGQAQADAAAARANANYYQGRWEKAKEDIERLEGEVGKITKEDIKDFVDLQIELENERKAARQAIKQADYYQGIYKEAMQDIERLKNENYAKGKRIKQFQHQLGVIRSKARDVLNTSKA